MRRTSEATGGLRLAALLVAALAVGGLSACGSDDDAEPAAAATSTADGGAAAKPAEAAVPFKLVHLKGQIAFAAVKLGLDKGLFKENGIDLTLEETTNPATVVPRVVSGEIDATQFTYGSLPVVAAAKLPLLAVAPQDVGPSGSEEDFHAVLASKSSGVTTVKQLAGKTVAVNTVGGLAELQIRIAAKQAGIDAKSIKLIAIPYPNMAAALRAKRVDAINVSEPWRTEIAESGTTTQLVEATKLVSDDLPLSTVMMAKPFIEKNKDTVRKFQLGMAASMSYAAEHPDEVRAVLPSFSGVSEKVAADMTLTKPVTTVNVANVQKVADLLAEYGLLKSAPDVAPLIYPGPDAK